MVSTFSILTISPGILYLFFLAFASLIFLYFSLIFSAAICAFFPGTRGAISSKRFIVSSVLSALGSAQIFFSKKYGFAILFLLIFVVKFSFLRSVESISVLKKCAASAGILFVVSFFGGIYK